MAAGVAFCRLVVTFVDSRGMLSTFVDSWWQLVAASLFMVFFHTTWRYVVCNLSGLSTQKDYQRCLDKLAGKKAREKICRNLISSSRNGSGAEFRPATESRPGAAAKGRATDELSQFS
jgi:hypothetical protein